MPSLKQFRYLTALARHGHFGKAAAACSVTQPALSMQIRELEQELGATLCERRSGGIVLTPVGTEIAKRAAQILDATADLVACAHAENEGLGSKLTLGIIPTLAPYVLPRLIQSMGETYPALRLDVRETHTDTLVSELLDGALDVLLLALPIAHRDVITLHLFDDPFLLAAPPGYSKAGTLAPPPETLQGERLLLLEEGHCLREQALSVCALQAKHDATVGVSSLSTLVQMVANGMGLTLLPQISAPVEAARADIMTIPFADPVPRREIGLAWRRSSPRTAPFTALGQMITTVCR
ncbi:MAG: hydrogen peroxide-inducible genes activator [Pseudomonadota bacterium]